MRRKRRAGNLLTRPGSPTIVLEEFRMKASIFPRISNLAQNQALIQVQGVKKSKKSGFAGTIAGTNHRYKRYKSQVQTGREMPAPLAYLEPATRYGTLAPPLSLFRGPLIFGVGRSGGADFFNEAGFVLNFSRHDAQSISGAWDSRALQMQQIISSQTPTAQNAVSNVGQSPFCADLHGRNDHRPG